MSSSENFGNPLRKFKLVFLGEQSGKESKIIKNYSYRHKSEDFPEKNQYILCNNNLESLWTAFRFFKCQRSLNFRHFIKTDDENTKKRERERKRDWVRKLISGPMI